MAMSIVPFEEKYLPQAGELLAQRHRRDRGARPELPERFADPSVAQNAVAAALRRPQARGFAALDGDRLAAYLVGDMHIDNLWGRSGWVRSAGCAYDPALGVEIVRDLYARLGAVWVSYGVFFHFALVPVGDPALVQAWFALSFGIEQVHALLDLQSLILPAPDAQASALPQGVEIRKAGAQDRARLAQMSDVIWRTQVEAPVWGVMMPETVAETEAGWAELVDEAEVTVWLALLDGETTATQGYWPAETADDNLLTPENCIELSVAGTRPELRGRGLGTLLTRHGLAQARAQGYRYCESDWRSANLLASRFWPRQGFRSMFYRLSRRVDQRIAWARGAASIPTT